MKKLAILALSLMTLSYGQAQKETLQLNLETGKTYRQVSHSASTIEQEVGGQKMNISMDIDASTSYLIKGIKDDIYTVEMRYDSIRMAMDMGMGNMSFNSHKKVMEETDYFSKMMKEFTNKPIMIKMTRSGKVTEVSNMDSVMKKAISRLTNIGEEQREQLRSQMEKSFGGEAFKNSFEMATAIFPDRQVAKGETWTNNYQLSSAMPATVNTTFTYSDKTPAHILIKGDSKIATTDKDKFSEMGGFLVKYDLNGSMTSNIKVDPKTGWIIEAAMDQTISGNTTMKAADTGSEPAQEMTIPMSIRTNAKTTNK